MSQRAKLFARALIFACGVTLFSPPSASPAAPVHGVVRLGFVDPGSRSRNTPDIEAFWKRLRELGYIEGQNLVIESRWAEGRFERLPGLMAEVLARKVDVLVTLSTPAAVAAKNATNTIPIVAAWMGDPVGTGLAVSLARPGGNVTGLSMGWGEGISGKWLELLHETVPNLSTVAVTANPDISVHRGMVRELEGLIPTRGLKYRMIEVRNPQALDDAFELARRSAQAVLVLADPITTSHRRRVTTLAAKHRLPAMYGLRDFVDVGGLMAYALDAKAMMRRTADYVDQVLKGAKPAELPIEQPTQYRLIVNLKTANALGLTFPESVLLRADEVIQ